MSAARSRALVWKCSVALTIVALAAACAKSPGPPSILAADPAETVALFLDAVRADDIRTMAQLWGTRAGPALETMDVQVAEQRLVVIASFLMHESFEVMRVSTLASENARERSIRVRLLRAGCEPVVPFTLLRTGRGWIINNIDLASAGNPTEICSRPTGSRR